MTYAFAFAVLGLCITFQMISLVATWRRNRALDLEIRVLEAELRKRGAMIMVLEKRSDG